MQLMKYFRLTLDKAGIIKLNEDVVKMTNKKLSSIPLSTEGRDWVVTHSRKLDADQSEKADTKNRAILVQLLGCRMVARYIARKVTNKVGCMLETFILSEQLFRKSCDAYFSAYFEKKKHAFLRFLDMGPVELMIMYVLHTYCSGGRNYTLEEVHTTLIVFLIKGRL